MNNHCVKSYSGPYSSGSLSIQSECGKMRTTITPNMDTFYAVNIAYKAIDLVLLSECLNYVTKMITLVGLL